MRVHIAEAVYGDAEIDAVVRVLREQRLALVAGTQCARFEARACDILGVRHSTLVSSGSSALLLALAALQLPPGSEVVTPALTFGTTVAPLVQLGLEPVFVDVAPGRLVVDPGSVEAAVGPFGIAMPGNGVAATAQGDQCPGAIVTGSADFTVWIALPA